jgi:hypothetical protein
LGREEEKGSKKGQRNKKMDSSLTCVTEELRVPLAKVAKGIQHLLDTVYAGEGELWRTGIRSIFILLLLCWDGTQRPHKLSIHSTIELYP